MHFTNFGNVLVPHLIILLHCLINKTENIREKDRNKKKNKVPGGSQQNRHGVVFPASPVATERGFPALPLDLLAPLPRCRRVEKEAPLAELLLLSLISSSLCFSLYLDVLPRGTPNPSFSSAAPLPPFRACSHESLQGRVAPRRPLPPC